MAINEWNKDDKGVILTALAGYEIAIFRHAVIGVRVLLADRSLTPGAPLASTQLSCSPDQARALAKSLSEAADRVEESTPEGTAKK